MKEAAALLKHAGWWLIGICFLAWPRTVLARDSHHNGAITEQDRAAIRSVVEQYRTSWLAGDEEGVMSTLTSDAVLMPAQGGAPVVGQQAIRQYWWPSGGPPSTITKLMITYDEIGGECGMAYARGRDEVGWTIGNHDSKQSHANSGMYLNVMRKLPDGSWRIARHMWDDDPAKRR